MHLDEIKGLKYYLILSVAAISFFVYSGLTGWLWFNPTKTEGGRPVGRSGYIYRYNHK
jgi:hypothetical protein